MSPVCESGVATSTFVTRLCNLAVVEEQEFGSSNFPATWVQTCYSCIIRENRGSHILSRNQGVALWVLFPSRSGIVGEEFVAAQTLVSRLLDVFVIEELEPDIGGATKRACLGDTHVCSGLHGRLGPGHDVGRHLVHERGVCIGLHDRLKPAHVGRHESGVSSGLHGRLGPAHASCYEFIKLTMNYRIIHAEV